MITVRLRVLLHFKEEEEFVVTATLASPKTTIDVFNLSI